MQTRHYSGLDYLSEPCIQVHGLHFSPKITHSLVKLPIIFFCNYVCTIYYY